MKLRETRFRMAEYKHSLMIQLTGAKLAGITAEQDWPVLKINPNITKHCNLHAQCIKDQRASHLWLLREPQTINYEMNSKNC